MTALHHEISGPADGPVLLMGGSLGTTLRMWDGQLPLAERVRLVRHDHRGHGASPVPPGPYEIADLGRDVLELMDTLGVESASYCGLSIGGMVGMWLGANAPDRVDRLVLICTSAYMPPASAWQERVRLVLEAGSVDAVADPIVDRWLTPAYAAEHRITQYRVDLEPGDLYFFNTRLIHEVPGVDGVEPRIVLATFIGYSPDLDEIFVWS